MLSADQSSPDRSVKKGAAIYADRPLESQQEVDMVARPGLLPRDRGQHPPVRAESHGADAVPRREGQQLRPAGQAPHLDGAVQEAEHGALRVGRTRVSLDSVVYAFLEGQSPESIQQNFPALSLEEVYGAIAYYLANREAVHEHLAIPRNIYRALWSG